MKGRQRLIFKELCLAFGICWMSALGISSILTTVQGLESVSGNESSGGAASKKKLPPALQKRLAARGILPKVSQFSLQILHITVSGKIES